MIKSITLTGLLVLGCCTLLSASEIFTLAGDGSVGYAEFTSRSGSSTGALTTYTNAVNQPDLMTNFILGMSSPLQNLNSQGAEGWATGAETGGAGTAANLSNYNWASYNQAGYNQAVSSQASNSWSGYDPGAANGANTEWANYQASSYQANSYQANSNWSSYNVGTENTWTNYNAVSANVATPVWGFEAYNGWFHYGQYEFGEMGGDGGGPSQYQGTFQEEGGAPVLPSLEIPSGLSTGLNVPVVTPLVLASNGFYSPTPAQPVVTGGAPPPNPFLAPAPAVIANPEPGAMYLIGGGLLALGWAARKRVRKP